MEQKKNNTSSQMLLDHCYTFGLLLWPSNSEEVVFRAQEPKAPVTYWDHALSGVRLSVVRPSVRRPSSVRLFTFSTSSPEPLDEF